MERHGAKLESDARDDEHQREDQADMPSPYFT
jgi:hypothetical protein